jgi:hypothetical protein
MLNTQELKDEMREDMRLEAKQEAYEQDRMKHDFEYLLEKCGVIELSDAIDEVAKQANKYGFEVNRSDVLEYLGEI